MKGNNLYIVKDITLANAHREKYFVPAMSIIEPLRLPVTKSGIIAKVLPNGPELEFPIYSVCMKEGAQLFRAFMSEQSAQHQCIYLCSYEGEFLHLLSMIQGKEKLTGEVFFRQAVFLDGYCRISPVFLHHFKPLF